MSHYKNRFKITIVTFIILLSQKKQKTKIIVVSIPDYVYNLFRQSSNLTATIKSEINNHSPFAKNIGMHNKIEFISSTEIIRTELE